MATSKRTNGDGGNGECKNAGLFIDGKNRMKQQQQPQKEHLPNSLKGGADAFVAATASTPLSSAVFNRTVTETAQIPATSATATTAPTTTKGTTTTTTTTTTTKGYTKSPTKLLPTNQTSNVVKLVDMRDAGEDLQAKIERSERKVKVVVSSKAPINASPINYLATSKSTICNFKCAGNKGTSTTNNVVNKTTLKAKKRSVAINLNKSRAVTVVRSPTSLKPYPVTKDFHANISKKPPTPLVFAERKRALTKKVTATHNSGNTAGVTARHRSLIPIRRKKGEGEVRSAKIEIENNGGDSILVPESGQNASFTVSGTKSNDQRSLDNVVDNERNTTAPISMTSGETKPDLPLNELGNSAGRKRKVSEDPASTPSEAATAAGPSTSTQVAEEEDKDKEEDKDAKKKKNRCAECRKKVGLTGFQCRCGGLFCAVHRYSDKHECTFNYREHGAQEIRRNNPVVVGEKIQKI